MLGKQPHETMTVTRMSQMWKLLDAYTLRPDGQERDVNQNNEWGGFSRRLNMPVFTAWRDLTEYNKDEKTTTALVCDSAWTGRPVGLANQERWLKFAEENCDGIAAFFVIHAKDEDAEVRHVQYIDDDRVFVGRIVRDGGKAFIVGKPRML